MKKEQEDRLSVELLKLLGSADFMRLVETYGGQRLFVSAGTCTDLFVTLGQQVATKLNQRYSKTYLRVPLARAFRARHYRAAGASNAEIARRLCMTETGVDKLFRRMPNRPAKGSADPRQLKLFGT